MRTIIIEGTNTVLTEEQVKKAYSRLQRESPPPRVRVRCLTEVKRSWSEQRGIVIIGSTQIAYLKSYPMISGIYTVVGEDGYGYTYTNEDNLLKCWDVMKF